MSKNDDTPNKYNDEDLVKAVEKFIEPLKKADNLNKLGMAVGELKTDWAGYSPKKQDKLTNALQKTMLKSGDSHYAYAIGLQISSGKDDSEIHKYLKKNYEEEYSKLAPAPAINRATKPNLNDRKPPALPPKERATKLDELQAKPSAPTKETPSKEENRAGATIKQASTESAPSKGNSAKPDDYRKFRAAIIKKHDTLKTTSHDAKREFDRRNGKDKDQGVEDYGQSLSHLKDQYATAELSPEDKDILENYSHVLASATKRVDMYKALKKGKDMSPEQLKLAKKEMKVGLMAKAQSKLSSSYSKVKTALSFKRNKDQSNDKGGR